MFTKFQTQFFLLLIPFLALPAFAQAPAGNKGSTGGAEGGVSGLASRTVLQKQELIKKADELATNAARMESEGLTADAMEGYKGAFDLLPAAPATVDRRNAYFKRYQTAAADHAQALIDQAEYEEAQKTLAGVYETARSNNLSPGILSVEVTRLMGRLKEGYFNEAMTPQHLKNVNEVDRLLKEAAGAVGIGRYDAARTLYHSVLTIDKYNSAARRGLEKIEALIIEYSETAQDQTRATMLRKIAEKWESPAPAELRNLGQDFEYSTATVGSNQADLERKLDKITIPSLEFQDTPLGDVLDFLAQKSQELDTEELDPAKRGISFIIRGGDQIRQSPVTLKLRNISLSAALRYVTQMVSMKYIVEEFAVAIVPLSSAEDANIVTVYYQVPPDFIKGQGGGGAAVNNDPFAQPDAGTGGGTLVARLTAQQFLEQSGVTFGEGASARFDPATGRLMVKNRTDQQSIVEAMVLAARETVPKNVLIKIRMISMQMLEAKELGFDVLMAQNNIGGSGRVFSSGGTFGNNSTRTNADFPFQGGGGPLTAGLRSGDTRTTLSIDDVIARTNAGSNSGGEGAAPGIFSLGGVFTDPQFQMILRALSQSKSIDKLCEASVVVKPGQRASIRQVREFIYPTEYDPPELPNSVGASVFAAPGGIALAGETASFPVTPANPTAFETRELGKVIEVEPVISEDNRSINLNIATDFSDFSGFINYGTPITQAAPGNPVPIQITSNRILMPVFDAVKETTNVTVWDGQTIAIGGIMTDSSQLVEDKVPGLGDLPVVGRVFRTRIETPSKRGVLMFVSSQILDPSDLPVNRALSEAVEVSQANPANQPVRN